MRLTRILSVAALTVCACGSAWGQVIVFTDRQAFHAVHPSVSLRQNFERFTQDTPFRTGPVTAEFITFSQEGPGDFRNQIDVLPLQFPLEGATTNVASLFTNSDGPTEVAAWFIIPMIAFGFDYFAVGDGEGASMDVMFWGNRLGTIDIPTGSGFIGFTLPRALTTHVMIRSRGTIPGSGGEGFAIDNLLALEFIPAPGPVALLGIAAAWCIRRPERPRS